MLVRITIDTAQLNIKHEHPVKNETILDGLTLDTVVALYLDVQLILLMRPFLGKTMF